MTKRTTDPTIEIWLREVNISRGGSVSLVSLAKLADLDPKSSHFRTCIARFKRALRERGIRAKVKAGQMSFLTFDQANLSSRRDWELQKKKSEDNLSLHMDTVDTRNAPTEQARQEALQMRKVLQATMTSMREVGKELPVPEDVKGNPRLHIVNGGKPDV